MGRRRSRGAGTVCDITQHRLPAAVKGLLRSVAASFPWFASLGQAWNEYEQYRVGQRIDELGENLRASLQDLHARLDVHEDRIAKAADQFPSLLEITIEKVRREFSDEKRRLYAHLLARLVVEGDTRTYDEKLNLIEGLDALNELDVKVLQLFKSTPEIAVRDLNLEPLGLSGDRNDQLQQLACSLSKLEARGLILTTFTHTGVVMIPQGLEKWVARWAETKYRIMPLGQKVVRALFD